MEGKIRPRLPGKASTNQNLQETNGEGKEKRESTKVENIKTRVGVSVRALSLSVAERLNALREGAPLLRSAIRRSRG